jgi:hypothetical protein
MTANYADSVSLKKRNLTSQKSADFQDNEDTPYVWKRNPSWPEINAEGSNTVIGSWAIRPNIDNIFCIESADDLDVVVKVGGTVHNTYGFSSAGVGDDFQFTIDYANNDFDDTDAPITLANTTNIITRTDHGYVDNDEIEFFNLSAGTNLNEKQIYYVVNANTSTFQVSETEGGSAVDINDGTGNLLPYKVCTIEISGANGDIIDTINFDQDPTNDYDLPGGTLPNGFHSGWLELHIDLPDLSYLYLGFISTSTPPNTSHSLLENIVIWRSSLRDFSFSMAKALKNIEFYYNTTNPGNMGQLSYAFASCHNLRRVYFDPLFQWSTVDFGQFSYAFQQCYSLTDIIGLKFGDIPTSGGTVNLTSTFEDCRSLRKLEDDIFQGASTQAASATFYRCHSLQEIPSGLNTSGTGNFNNTFRECYNLKKAPAYDMSSATQLSNTFSNCRSLEEIPAYDTSSATNLTYFLNNCVALKELPSSITIPSGCNTNSMLAGCYSLQRLPDTMDFSNSTSMTFCFSACTKLIYIPPFDAVDINMGNCFRECRSLYKIQSKTVPFKPTDGSSIFSDCDSLTSIPQIDLSNTPDMDRSFYNCKSLKEIPEFLNPISIKWDYAFQYCYSLVKAPKISSTITACNNMFEYCYSLRFVPNYDISGTGNYNYMFRDCRSLEEVGNLITNTTTLSSLTSMFQDCFNLRKIGAMDFSSTAVTTTTNLFNDAPLMDVTGFIGPDISFDMSDCFLSSDQLDELYTNLPSTTGATLTVTGNYGTDSDTPSIATAKGWTVTG